jgi:putative Mg2+ transporter-C (MgtC) family protein
VDRGALTLDSLRGVLGRGSERVKHFVVQQSDEAPECDDVVIGFARLPADEFAKACDSLRHAPGVRALREETESIDNGENAENGSNGGN